ncbi:hypothetical protein BV898_16825 [Hypsibius exemplaris]|uniref:Tyr recombinase domain-containing protein n=1 Tax=Hypsibius exemplaris TaxID=2072580 RepID=A0A9X6RLV4_HYPEX|nr:hypothetical protein BV898_16825 [Hypsibius exemplaris]
MRLSFHCDNLGVGQAWDRLGSSSPAVLHLMRLMATAAATSNFIIKIVHIRVRVYLAGISNALLELGYPPLAKSSLIKRALKGYQRLKATPPDSRLPITLNILRLIKNRLSSSQLSPYCQQLYWTACTFAFFGFLRVGEFCTSSQTTTRASDHTLLSRHASLRPDGSLCLLLPHSKTDPTGTGQTIILSPTHRSVCPVTAFRNFIRLRRQLQASSTSLPLFIFPDGSFLSRSVFSSALKRFLCNLPNSHLYSTHSFRIGAATIAAEALSSDTTIQKAGRWKSATYRGYIRTSSPNRRIKFFSR